MQVVVRMLAVLALTIISFTAHAGLLEAQHGIAMHGKPKYPKDFTHFEYVSPEALKGGELKMAARGTFDSLNPFTLKGVAAPGVANLVYQTLLEESKDEAFTKYGSIAKSIETPDDRSWVAFNLRPNAKWSDGKPLTAEDVVFSFETLKHKGHPFYRSYYANVKSAVAETPQRVKFTFDMTGNRELPLIMGQLPILPKHIWSGKDFESMATEMPVGSGPYKVKEIDTGRSITFERVDNWWAEDLPIYNGRYNFDVISYDLFRDETVLLQALFSGEYDVRHENIAKSWNSEYNVKPVKEGLIKMDTIDHEIPAGMQAFVFNLRRPIFQDAKVRQALNHTFDFGWSNKQFAFGTYKRTKSYFENSELASSGVPKGRELEILEKFKDQLPPELFTQEFRVPKTNGTGRDMRGHLRKAKQLLSEAGWVVNDKGVLEKDGQPFAFEFLLHSPAFERWINPMILNLKKLGIDANIRVVDAAQYQARLDSFDFDVTIKVYAQSSSPGNEQRDFWGSDKADIQGSRNLIGIKNPVVDALIDMVIAAPDREELVYRTRALDRVLLWGYYVIPQWHINYFRLAYWDKFGKPKVAPKYDLGVIDTWWYDAKKADSISSKVKPEEK